MGADSSAGGTDSHSGERCTCSSHSLEACPLKFSTSQPPPSPHFSRHLCDSPLPPEGQGSVGSGTRALPFSPKPFQTPLCPRKTGQRGLQRTRAMGFFSENEGHLKEGLLAPRLTSCCLNAKPRSELSELRESWRDEGLAHRTTSCAGARPDKSNPAPMKAVSKVCCGKK